MYLLNYSVYKPPDSWKSTHKSFLDNSVACGVSLSPAPAASLELLFLPAQHLPSHSALPALHFQQHLVVIDAPALACRAFEAPALAVQAFTEQSMAFQTKMVANGGLGQETYLPEGEPSSSHLKPISAHHQHES